MQSQLPTDGNKKWLPVLQPLKGLAFLGVYLCHSDLLNLGAGSVEIFFILSGFLAVYQHWDKPFETTLPGALRYTANRVRKLYLLHVLMLVVMFVPVARSVMHRYISTTPGELAVQALANLFLIQSWFPYITVFFAFNGTSWFLSSSILMYFLTPFLFIRIRNFSARRALAGIFRVFALLLFVGVGLTLLQRRGFDGISLYWLIYICPVMRLGDYAIGCLLAVVFVRREELPPVSRRAATAWEILAVVLFALVQYCYISRNWPLRGLDLRYTLPHLPGAALLVYFAALSRGDLLRRLLNRPLVFLGEIGMYAFLIHVPVISTFDRLWDHFTAGGMNLALRGILCFVLTLLLSVAWKRFAAWLHGRAPALV